MISSISKALFYDHGESDTIDIGVPSAPGVISAEFKVAEDITYSTGEIAKNTDRNNTKLSPYAQPDLAELSLGLGTTPNVDAVKRSEVLS